jgi:hypothetical protein
MHRRQSCWHEDRVQLPGATCACFFQSCRPSTFWRLLFHFLLFSVASSKTSTARLSKLHPYLKNTSHYYLADTESLDDPGSNPFFSLSLVSQIAETVQQGNDSTVCDEHHFGPLPLVLQRMRDGGKRVVTIKEVWEVECAMAECAMRDCCVAVRAKPSRKCGIVALRTSGEIPSQRPRLSHKWRHWCVPSDPFPSCFCACLYLR